MLKEADAARDMQEASSDGEVSAGIAGMVSQHVIDPELCVYCLGCYGVCPTSAIEDGRGVMAIDAEKCDDCRECVAECATGAIETWISVPEGEFYSVEEQFAWDSLPAPAIT